MNKYVEGGSGMKKKDILDILKEDIKGDLAVTNNSLKELKAMYHMNMTSNRAGPGGAQYSSW